MTLGRKPPRLPIVDPSSIGSSDKKPMPRIPILLTAAIFCAGCVHVQKNTIPAIWPRLMKASSLSQFAGEYELTSSNKTSTNGYGDAFADLVYFLTGVRSNDTINCRLVVDKNTLILERTLKSGSPERLRLDVAFENGGLFIRIDSGGSVDPMGAGSSSEKFYLYLADDGSLVGRSSTRITALFLWAVPVIGSGENWFLWKKTQTATERHSSRAL